MTLDYLKILKRALVTEKTNFQKDTLNHYGFEVATWANKHQIKKAVVSAFKVEVLDVRTVLVRGKKARVGKSLGKKSNWKKAYVTLKEGSTIDLFGTM